MLAYPSMFHFWFFHYQVPGGGGSIQEGFHVTIKTAKVTTTNEVRGRSKLEIRGGIAVLVKLHFLKSDLLR